MREDTLNPITKKERHLSVGPYLVLGLFAMGFIFWQVWQIYTVPVSTKSSEVTYETPSEFIGLPQGRIYMTLFSPEGSDLQPYIFDVARNQFKTAPVDNLSVAFHQTFSGDSTAFIGTTRAIFEDSNGDADTALQVYTSAIGNGTSIAQVSQSTRMTQESLLGKRSLSISDDSTKVLFVAYEGDISELPITADGWGVYFTDGYGAAIKITNGMYPNWVDDNNFVYLKSDGIYIYNISNEKESMVWGYSAETQTNMMMHLSEDKRTLAWTLPDNGLVLVLKLTSVTVPKMKKVAQINTSAFWPVVSPDGNFVAVQAVNWSALDSNPQPRIELYSIQEEGNPQKLRATLNLEAFDQTRMFITDWRK